MTRIWADEELVHNEVVVTGIDKIDKLMEIIKEVVNHMIQEHCDSSPDNWVWYVRTTRSGIEIDMGVPVSWPEHMFEIANKIRKELGS